jgi:hypothetical protein
VLPETLGLPPSVTHPATLPHRDRRSSRIHIAVRPIPSTCSQSNHTCNKMAHGSTSYPSAWRCDRHLRSLRKVIDSAKRCRAVPRSPATDCDPADFAWKSLLARTAAGQQAADGELPSRFASRMRSEHSDEQSAEQLQKVDHSDDESNRSSHICQPGCNFRYPQGLEMNRVCCCV